MAGIGPHSCGDHTVPKSGFALLPVEWSSDTLSKRGRWSTSPLSYSVVGPKCCIPICVLPATREQPDSQGEVLPTATAEAAGWTPVKYSWLLLRGTAAWEGRAFKDRP